MSGPFLTCYVVELHPKPPYTIHVGTHVETSLRAAAVIAALDLPTLQATQAVTFRMSVEGAPCSTGFGGHGTLTVKLIEAE